MMGAGLPRDVDLEFPRWQLATSCVSPGAARNFATSGGRTEVLRREVTGMDARQALRPRMGRSARSSREQGRSEGTRSKAEGRMNGASIFWFLFDASKRDPP